MLLMFYPLCGFLNNFHLQHVVKATTSGYISGLRVTAGQQVSDGTALFNVKVSHAYYYSVISCACVLINSLSEKTLTKFNN